MTAEADRLRREMAETVAAHRRGDLHERTYAKRIVEQSVDLCRAEAQARLRAGEGIRAEHHAVKAHLQLHQSVLRETTQEAVSLFLTDRRLIRFTSLLEPHRPFSCDDRDGTLVNDLEFCDISKIETRREFRFGEMAAGAVIALLAFAFRDWLQVTGTLMIALGVLGILHGLLLPTRWVEVHGREPGAAATIAVLALRKKSARKLLRLLRETATTGAFALGQGDAHRVPDHALPRDGGARPP